MSAVLKKELPAVADFKKHTAQVIALCDDLNSRSLILQAQRQQKQFAFTPWEQGKPTHDVLGNSIAYKDAGEGMDSRYWVSEVQQSGAHIRSVIGKRFYAIAPTDAEAKALGDAYAVRRDFISPNLEAVTARADGWIVARYMSYCYR